MIFSVISNNVQNKHRVNSGQIQISVCPNYIKSFLVRCFKLVVLFIHFDEYAGLPQFSNVTQAYECPDCAPNVRTLNIETSDMCLYGGFHSGRGY